LHHANDHKRVQVAAGTNDYTGFVYSNVKKAQRGTTNERRGRIRARVGVVGQAVETDRKGFLLRKAAHSRTGHLEEERWGKPLQRIRESSVTTASSVGTEKKE